MKILGPCLLPEPHKLLANVLVNPPPFYIGMAAKHLAANDAQKALDALLSQEKKADDNPWGWIVAATAHWKLKNHSVSCQVAQRGLDKVGKNTHLHECLAVAHFCLDDHGEAMKHFITAIQLNSRNTSAITNLANLLLIQNNHDDAVKVLENGLSHNPRSQEIQHFMSQMPDIRFFFE
jgi:Flp pilus assembly protein TadD